MHLKTVLDIVSQAALEIGITQQKVNSVVNSPDQDITQMRELIYAVADEVLAEEPYQVTLGDQHWIVGADGVFKDSFSADTDIIMFDGRLAINGIKWRFLKAKGLEFGEEQRDYIARMNKLAARANQRVLDLDLDWSRQQ